MTGEMAPVSVVQCPLDSCGWEHTEPTDDVPPEALAGMFGFGVMTAVAAQQRAQRFEHALCLHFEGHKVEDYLRTITRQQQVIGELHRAIAAMEQPDYGPGHHVTITVDPERNYGRVSFSRGMAPVHAAIGLLNAGDGVEQVREEYALDEAQAAVVAALAEDFQDLAAGVEPAPAEEALRPVYRERAQLVAFLAGLYRSVIAFSDPEAPEWPVVYVDTPDGQCSWHIALADLDLFGHIEQVPADDPRARWDGHSTEEKYQRLASLAVPRGERREPK